MRPSWLSVLCMNALLVALTISAYSTVPTCDFVSYDDPQYVSANGHVLAGLSSSSWRYAWTTGDCGNWHPLTWLSLELDGTLWHRNPAGFHTTNLIFHCVNVLLLLFILWWMTGCYFRCAFVAALFAVHPLHVESVAWISERKDVLSTFFLLVATAAYARYVTAPSVGRYLLVFALFGLGLLAKPMLVTTPLLFMLLDHWPLNRVQGSTAGNDVRRFPTCTFQQCALEKIPMLTLAFADGLMTIYTQQIATPKGLPLTIRLANVFGAYAWYLQKTFVPTNLCVFYPHPEQALHWGSVVAGMFLMITITVWVLWHVKSRPWLTVGWSWFVVSLLPVIGLLQVGLQAYADRYAYIPHIGLLILIVWQMEQGMAATKLGRLTAILIGVAALLVCVTLTRMQMMSWKSSEALWTRAITVDPQNYVAHFHLADLRQAARDYEGAIEHLAIGLKTGRGANSANAQYDWGRCLIALHREAQAEEHFRNALELDQDHVRALEELAKLMRNQGRTEEAIQFSERYEVTLVHLAKTNPTDAVIPLKCGLLRARQGRMEDAIAYFEQSNRISPSAMAYNNQGMALEELHRSVDARKSFQRALELDPNFAKAHCNIAMCYMAEHDLQSARKHFAEAFRLNPDDLEAERQLQRLTNP